MLTSLSFVLSLDYQDAEFRSGLCSLALKMQGPGEAQRSAAMQVTEQLRELRVDDFVSPQIPADAEKIGAGLFVL